jgi:hypothetical protein
MRSVGRLCHSLFVFLIADYSLQKFFQRRSLNWSFVEWVAMGIQLV